MSPPTVDSTKDIDQKPSQRKINKPLIEKRRRARINECLSQLKTIVLSASESKSPRPSKLEKADILEMTVEFVKDRLCSDNAAQKGDTGTQDNNSEYLAGYSKCLNEISKFLNHTRPSSLKQDIVDHVSEKLKEQLPCPNKEVTNVRILPRADSVTSEETSEEAIDLRVSNTEQQNDTEMLNDSKLKRELQSQQSITVTGIQNISTPVGLVCGGQVMFLVQIPQAMTSQTIQTPMMSSFQLSQSQSLPVQGSSYPIITNPVSSAVIPYLPNHPQNILPMVGVQQTLPHSVQVPQEVHNTHARVILSDTESTIDPIRIKQNNTQSQSHWRSW